MPFLQSAAIESVSYDEEAQTLSARYRADGRVVLYEGVPQDVYDSLIFSDSIADFISQQIAGRYRERARGEGDDVSKCSRSG